ncbi:MAG TPA: hypothetical protein VK530_01505 [Candidatus Acidoferrum sp.]|nr:hypothetical protein [Candidatus Acidoferrum sp.]
MKFSFEINFTTAALIALVVGFGIVIQDCQHRRTIDALKNTTIRVIPEGSEMPRAGGARTFARMSGAVGARNGCTGLQCVAPARVFDGSVDQYRLERVVLR